ATAAPPRRTPAPCSGRTRAAGPGKSRRRRCTDGRRDTARRPRGRGGTGRSDGGRSRPAARLRVRPARHADGLRADAAARGDVGVEAVLRMREWRGAGGALAAVRVHPLLLDTSFGDPAPDLAG